MYDAIPEELRKIDRWVGVKNGSKCPWRAFEPEPASASDPATWCDFDTACEAVSLGYYDGVGFVFCGDGYVGIDIDDGWDEEGFISPLASDIISVCDSYTEQSRSGRGFHIIVKGDLPFRGKNNYAGVEIYSTGRYFIMTGNCITSGTIRPSQAAIDYVVNQYFSDIRIPSTQGSSGLRSNYGGLWEKPSANHVKLNPAYPKVTPGSRNQSLASLAGTLWSVGYNREYIYNLICDVNKGSCEPPLPNGEIRQLVRSVTKYER